MNLKDFSFHLPEELIAQDPLEKRSESKLLILDKHIGTIKHDKFIGILNNIESGDCLVLNDTRVIPARLIGTRKGTGAKVEVLLLHRVDKDQWEVLVKPGKKARIGDIINFGKGLLEAEVVDVLKGGNRLIKFHYKGVFEQILDELGQMPIPPYITHQLEDKERYQTVYAKKKGSAAAPTAGLHFTKKLLQQLKEKGVTIAYITLHVGLGTFRPVKVEDIKMHEMHSEYYSIVEKEANKINNVIKNGGKIIAVGTTSCRTLETAANEKGLVEAGSGWTDIFIYPSYKFKVVDSLITNFHLPESTLIMLVSALAGRENIINAYQIAIDKKYRFYSLGDAMMIK